MNIQDVLERLDGARPCGSGWRARCPAHGDRMPSLSIGEGEDGRVLVRCHAGCATESVVEAAGLAMRDLMPKSDVSPSSRSRAEAPRRKRRSYDTPQAAAEAVARASGQEVVGSWEYHDDRGLHILSVFRFEPPGGGDKTFRPVSLRDGRWRIGDPPLDRLPLYRLPDLEQANGSVFVAEGEKCVDALVELGLSATTSPHGARSARRAEWSPLAGRDVILLPDSDRAGERYAEDVAGILLGLEPPATVRTLTLDGLPAGGDVVEWIGEQVGRGLTAAELSAELLERAETASPAEPRTNRDSAGARDLQRPEIHLVGGRLHENVDDAEQALLDADIQLFRRDTDLVRVRHPSPVGGDAVTDSVATIQPVDPPHLVEVFTRVARFVRELKDGSTKVVNCPQNIANTYLARAGDWRLPHLLGVISCPTLRRDGTVLSEPGYDPASGLYLDTADVRFPPVPNAPTLDDARAATGTLVDPLRDFPWLEPADRATALAAILTAIARSAIRTAPMFAIRAPKMGSGKSLLADVVAMIATGQHAAVMSQGKDEDEDRKRMLSILLAGLQVACIDNIERPFGGSVMCSVLTQATYRDRVLGRSKMISLPTAVTWLVTGNNIEFVGDITTRVLPCDLDPRCEAPERRRFERNLHKYVPQRRPDLVAAALTVLRAYHVAGRPDQGLDVFGRFEEWSDLIRSALVWCGEADPCLSRRRIEDRDPVRDRLRLVLEHWYGQFKTRAVTAARALAAQAPALQAALADLDPSGSPSPRQLGRWLSSVERRIEGDLRFERAGEDHGVTLWRVVRAGASSGFDGFDGFVSARSKLHPRQNPTAASVTDTRTGSERAPRTPSNPSNPSSALSTPTAEWTEATP